MASVRDMILLYDAGYSVVLLIEKSICMGKWAVPNWGKFFHHVVVVGMEQELASRTRLPPNCLADVVLSRMDEGAGAKKIEN